MTFEGIAGALRRFWKFAIVAGEDECWPWLGRVNHRGYGWFWLEGRNIGAHRAAYQLLRGPIPAGMCVCHRCDNPPCVNPHHLFTGSQQENQADKVAKNRQARHEAHGASKLTWLEVARLRALFAAGASKKALARSFGISRTAVRAIVNERVWRTS